MSTFAFRSACVAFVASAFITPLPAAAAPSDRPIELIVPGPAGGTPDVLSRLFGEQLGARLGQPVIVINRPGASGFIGVQAAAQAKPDGHTLLMGFAQTMAVNPVAYNTIPYDPIEDFEPIARLVDFELVLAVPGSLPVDDVKGLAAWMKENPERLSFGSFGAGSPSQFAGEVFAQSTGVAAQHIPYKGSSQLV
ncbi:MAG: Bug family tripartite tricarboxylate transporter substrate binding protein, partial [Pigmentiphaga sp.]